MLRLIACIPLIAFAITASAQNDCNLTVSGQVVDEHDGSVLSYADIVILGTNLGTISNELGYYSIGGLCAGKLIIACSHVGCEPIYDTIEVSQNIVHNFYPEHHAELLNAVRIDEKKDTDTKCSRNGNDRISRATKGKIAWRESKFYFWR